MQNTIERNYEKGGLKGYECITACDLTGKRVGSGNCTKKCAHYHSHNEADLIVNCFISS